MGSTIKQAPTDPLVPSVIVRWLQGALVLSLALSAAACKDETPRNPVPAAFVDEAELPGYAQIRVWGDRDTPAFESAMKTQFVAVEAAAKAGKLPDEDRRAAVLAISGGGDQGAFAAGYLRGWSELGSRPDFETVTGVSTGALAAPFAFLGPRHDADLKAIYTDTDAGELYDTRWDLGAFSSSLKDTAPLRKTIAHFATDALMDEIAAQYRLGRRLLVATTNLDAQRPVIWDLSAIAASGQPGRRDLFIDLLVATSAVPGIFPPVRIKVRTNDGEIHDELHADGFPSMQMFFVPPGIKLTETEQAVFGHRRERTLYVLRNGKLFPEYAKTDETALAILQRGVSILAKYQAVYNLRLLEGAARDSRTRFKFMGVPKSFDGVPGKRFDPAYAAQLFAAGRKSGFRQEWLDKVPETPELMIGPSSTVDRAER